CDTIKKQSHATVVENTTCESFEFSPVVKDRLDHWLDCPVDRHCRRYGPFDRIDQFCYVAALLPFLFLWTCHLICFYLLHASAVSLNTASRSRGHESVNEPLFTAHKRQKPPAGVRAEA